MLTECTKMMQRSNLFVSCRILSFVALRRNCIKPERVRVRFAPSPTGYLHLGGLRTALYNYLFAKASSGKFILRIEDTDQSRLVEDAADQLENDLEWAGIIPDESPKKGGFYGPYLQSQRLPFYKQHAESLVKKGQAYRCFCTPRRLDLLRQQAVRSREIPRYDNRCRNLSESDINNKLNEGQPFCIRFKLECEGNWNDLILGPIGHDVSGEGDPILLKTDGFPTYHLACVVDDHLMDITHVLRGVEWQISTPKHLQLYRAFQWQPPAFGHLPLLLNSDGTKLSKRQGGVTVAEQRSAGVYPRSLVTLLTLAGGGFPNDSPIGVHLDLPPMTPSELVPHFDLSLLRPSSCRLPLDKLPLINQLEIQRQLNSTDEVSCLVSELSILLKKHFAGRKEENSLQLQHKYILEVLKWAIPRIHYLPDFLSPNLAFLWQQPSQPLVITEKETNALQSVYSSVLNISKENFQPTEITAELKKISSSENIPFSRLMKLLRLALSGLQQGPSVAEMFLLLGPNESLRRLKSAISTASVGV